MAYVPMNRTRALTICTRPQDYAPSGVHAAVHYLEILVDATAEELELATKAHLFLQQASRELLEQKAGSRGGACEGSEEADRRR